MTVSNNKKNIWLICEKYYQNNKIPKLQYKSKYFKVYSKNIKTLKWD